MISQLNLEHINQYENGDITMSKLTTQIKYNKACLAYPEQVTNKKRFCTSSCRLLLISSTSILLLLFTVYQLFARSSIFESIISGTWYDQQNDLYFIIKYAPPNGLKVATEQDRGTFKVNNSSYNTPVQEGAWFIFYDYRNAPQLVLTYKTGEFSGTSVNLKVIDYNSDTIVLQDLVNNPPITWNKCHHPNLGNNSIYSLSTWKWHKTDDVDLDSDGYKASAQLTLNITAHSGVHLVFYKVYYKLTSSNSYNLFQISNPSRVTQQTNMFETILIGGTRKNLPHNRYDLRIELYEVGNSKVWTSIGPNDDPNLRDLKFETDEEDGWK